MGGSEEDEAVRSAVREKVRELATLSRDLENLTRQMSAAVSTVQVGFLKDRVDKLTVTQRQLIGEIAERCPDAALKDSFETLDRRLENVRQQVKDAKAADELEALRDEIDPLVDSWAATFQQLVVVTVNGNAGAPPAAEEPSTGC